MRTTDSAPWRALAHRQAGVLSRSQLRRLGVDADRVRAQLHAERWQIVTPTVVATSTGILTREQLAWAGVLHGGTGAAIGGLSALATHGLKNWHRDDLTVMVPKSSGIEPVAGLEFVETRRDASGYLADTTLATWRVEPAALLFAAYEPVTRSAYGLLAAVVQQRLTTADRLVRWIGAMRPLRRARAFRQLLAEIDGGAQSLAEVDVARMCRTHHLPTPRRQNMRRDSSGRRRYTDAEWPLPNGQVVVLEVDGGFHMSSESWEDDIGRERGLVARGAILVRCTARELRDDPDRVARDLIMLGVRSSSG
ncbi:hypothetical protein [Nocardioides terrisoli]|uniref:hypothetical protein n=1 Tax=Nocardioides terrisoli TaxID=3388267 RepID=UPI00287BC3E6|nr:hypothetical protein [Nocardioides marmorisolisilvae]